MKYTITCELTDAENAEIVEMADAIGKTPEEFFQRFWDGYTSEGVTMTGIVRMQIDQWLTDRLKTQIADRDTADILALLKDN